MIAFKIEKKETMGNASILQLLSLSGEMMLEQDTQADKKACDAIGNDQKDRSSPLEYVSLRSNNFVKLVLSR